MTCPSPFPVTQPLPSWLTIKTIRYEADIPALQPSNLETTIVEMDGPLHVTLSVGGMTCVACSSTITRLLSELEGVTNISINLIGNSASLVVQNRKSITEVQEVIESAGYEASVASVQPVDVTPNLMKAARGQHTIALRIEGMFCK